MHSASEPRVSISPSGHEDPGEKIGRLGSLDPDLEAYPGPRSQPAHDVSLPWRYTASDSDAEEVVSESHILVPFGPLGLTYQLAGQSPLGTEKRFTSSRSRSCATTSRRKRPNAPATFAKSRRCSVTRGSKIGWGTFSTWRKSRLQSPRWTTRHWRSWPGRAGR